MGPADSQGWFHIKHQNSGKFLTANKKNVMAVLTDSQKKTFDKMKGESFEFPEPAQRRGRGRGGN